jgi:DNA-binding MarR family transcriptional regulator
MMRQQKRYAGVVAKPRWLDDRQQRLWQAYLHMNQYLYALMEQQLVRDSGLSGSDYKVLHPLSEAPGGLLRARELCTEIGWDRSRLSHHVTRMEKRGLVARQECEEDGRGLMVQLTAAGRKTVEAAAPAHVENVRRYFFDLVSDEELETLTAVFERVLRNLACDTAMTSVTDVPGARVAQA